MVSRPEFGGSGLTVAANRGGDFRGAAGVDALAATMRAALTAGAGPTLVSGYHPDLDRHGHLTGVDSALWRVAAAEVDELLARLVDGLPPDAALLVTADHGQLNVPAEHRFDLDTDPRLRAGVHLVAGEARVRYLHVVPGATDDVVAAWSAVLGDAARVRTRDEVVAAGWFGPVPEEHLARIGDVVVICNDDVRGDGHPHRAADGVAAGRLPRVGHGGRDDRPAVGRPRLTARPCHRAGGGDVVPPG